MKICSLDLSRVVLCPSGHRIHNWFELTNRKGHKAESVRVWEETLYCSHLTPPTRCRYLIGVVDWLDYDIKFPIVGATRQWISYQLWCKKQNERINCPVPSTNKRQGKIGQGESIEWVSLEKGVWKWL